MLPLRLLPALLILGTLAACGSLARPSVAPGPIEASAVEEVFVASLRERTPAGAWTSEPSGTIAFLRYRVSVPPLRDPGQSPRYDAPRLDPERDFIAVAASGYPSAADLARAVRASGDGEALVYVHGFKTDFSSSLYQLTQIGTDVKLRGARVLYAWPSQTRFSGYLRDSRIAAQSKDGLVALIEELDRAGVRRITLVGYSLGALLVFDAIEAMKRSSSPALGRLAGVVLLSPDIDLGDFRDRTLAMGGLPQPFVVYAAPDDVALRAVALVTAGGRPRLGSLLRPDMLADVELVYIDTDDVPQLEQPGHLPVATAPGMIEAINAMPRPDMVLYARAAAAGRLPGISVRRYGKLSYVTLPEP